MVDSWPLCSAPMWLLQTELHPQTGLTASGRRPVLFFTASEVTKFHFKPLVVSETVFFRRCHYGFSTQQFVFKDIVEPSPSTRIITLTLYFPPWQVLAFQL